MRDPPSRSSLDLYLLSEHDLVLRPCSNKWLSSLFLMVHGVTEHGVNESRHMSLAELPIGTTSSGLMRK